MKLKVTESAICLGGKEVKVGSNSIDLTKALSKRYKLVRKRWYHNAIESLFKRRDLTFVGAVRVHFPIYCDKDGNISIGREYMAGE